MSSRGILRLRLVRVTLCVAAGALAACGDDDSAGREQGVTLSDLSDRQFLDDPGRFLGKQVTVSGEVSEVVSPRAFRVGGEGAAEGIGLLVFASGNQPTVNDNMVVKVTGKVRLFETEEFEEDLGFDLADAEFEVWEGNPAIMASSVTVVEQSEQ